MSKKQYIGLVVILIIIFAIIFLWYGVRPSIIKSNCSSQSKKQIGEGNCKSIKCFEDYYSVCLKDRGL